MQGQKSFQQQQAQQQKKAQVQQYRQGILGQILTPEAKDRLKAQKAIGIENALIQAAQTGMLKNRVTQQQLITMLQKDSKQKQAQKITFKRRGIDDQW